MTKNTTFDKFTNKYALSKTLRFELKPIWNTQAMLDAEHIFETDRIRREKYKKTRPWIDRLHREFINEALENFRFKDLSQYHQVFRLWQSDKKSGEAKSIIAKEELKLREEIVIQFNATAKKWAEKYPNLKLKKVDIGMLFEAGIFEVLKERYKNESETALTTDYGEKMNIFDDWKGWTGYFKKFFQTRKNFYSSGDESTAVAYRIVNQNLYRFAQNIQIFEQAKDKIDIAKIEKGLGFSCNKILSLENYNDCLLQGGIDTYNRVIGGYVGENDEKIPGINQAINEYRRHNKGDKIKFLSMLDKQIHSEKDKLLGEIEDTEELVKALDDFAKASHTKLTTFRALLQEFAMHSDQYALEKIYISSESFERNASRWFANYSIFEQALLETAKNHKDAYSLIDQKLPQKKDSQVKYPDFFICSHLRDAFGILGEGVFFKNKYYEEIAGFDGRSSFEQFLYVIKHEVEQKFLHKDSNGVKVGYEFYRQQIQALLSSNDSQITPEAKITIKNFADSALLIYQIGKYFAVEKKRRWLDNFDLDDRFYNANSNGYMSFYTDAYEDIVQGYNALRNYLTKKPYSTDKWVLNFEIQTLADGWDKNKEKENGTLIFRKDGRYYLGIMRHDHKDLFADKNNKEYLGTGFEKMEYKQIADPSKDIQNLIFVDGKTIMKKGRKDLDGVNRQLESIKNKYLPKEINDIRKNRSYLKSSENFSEKSVNIFVNYYKERLIEYYKSNFIFTFKDAYSDFNEFSNHITEQTYWIKFINVSEKYITKQNKEGKLFIFKIHSKDWNLKHNKKKAGTKNLHTLYWEQLFSEVNKEENFVFKLNGEAELFFRPATEEGKWKYKAYDERDGKWKEINKDNNGNLPTGAVLDHKRYTRNEIYLHCPITLNRVSEGKTKAQMDADIRKAISGDKNIRIIGVDRGEKHLVYYSMIDQEDNIVEQGSLNSIGEANGESTPYAEILGSRAKERERARREWRDVDSIKDLKRGYVSQVARKIADLATQHPNAIIVLEDLNMRFKQVRGGIEKSTYQQFEKQLIEKLSFLVNKNEVNPVKSGYPLHAYQLCSPFKSFREMGKQTGIIFYTAAGYTSRTCSVCGFRRNVRFQCENVEKAVEAIENLEEFIYDRDSDAFRVAYSLSKFLSRDQKGENKASNGLYEKRARKDKFVITTKDAIRYKWFQNGSPRLRAIEKEKGVSNDEEQDKEATKRGRTKKFDVTLFFKSIFEKQGISLTNGDLRGAIKEKNSKDLFEKLFFALYLLTETRQTISGTNIDYIHCPECGFDSRKGFHGNEFNGDANGAYNIARKGVMVLEKIRQFQKKNDDLARMRWGDLNIGIEEWDKYAQIISIKNRKS